MTSKLKFWRKKKVSDTPPVAEPRILTGIEKHEQELREIAWQERNAEVTAIYKRIYELEAEIAPQVALISQLRAQVTPQWSYYAQMQAQANPLMQYQSLRSYSGLFGGVLGGACGGD